MRNTHQHIIIRVKLLQLPDTALRFIMVMREPLRDVVEGRRPVRLRVDLLHEETPRTAAAEAGPRRGGHVLG